MTTKKPRMPSKVVKKVASKKPKVEHAYRVRFGTRNELGPEQTFATEALAKKAIIHVLDSWKGWLERYNRVGLVTLDDSKAEASGITFLSTPKRLECAFDEHTGMHVIAEYRKE